jgi:hypothetical protein
MYNIVRLLKRVNTPTIDNNNNPNNINGFTGLIAKGIDVNDMPHIKILNLNLTL